MCYTGRKSNECIRSQNRKLSLRAFFAKQSPYRNEEIASSQRTLLAMTQCTEFISAQYIRAGAHAAAGIRVEPFPGVGAVDRFIVSMYYSSYE